MMAEQDDYESRVPEDWDGPTVRVKNVEYPDRTENQTEADKRRKEWEKAHK
jgi:hypothetical protein